MDYNRFTTTNQSTKEYLFTSYALLDYLSVRQLYNNKEMFFLDKIINLAGEFLEKIMKAYLLKNNINIEKLSHNLDNIRKECEKLNSFFTHPKIINFCDEYGKMGGSGNQLFRYGSLNKDYKDHISYGGNLIEIVNLCDEFFLILYHDEHYMMN